VRKGPIAGFVGSAYTEIEPRAVFGRHFIQCVRGGVVNLANLTGGRHEQISYLTSKSRKNFLTKIDGYSGSWKPNYLLTLTYPKEFPKDGRVVKGDLNAFYGSIVGGHGYTHCYDKACKFAWKMEFQQRGAPHFHILVESSLGWEELLALCNRFWLSITKNNDDHGVKLERVRDSFAVGIYISLHFSKGSQNFKPKDFANPGRFWGFLGFKDVPWSPPETISAGMLSSSRGVNPGGQNQDYA
jgi:hypothetical protein